MLLALAILGCWRPEPYTPPEAPEPAAAGEAAEPQAGEEAGEEAPAEGAPAPDGAADDAPDEAPAAEAEPDAEDVPSAPDFTSYNARTVQAPVTIVDDWGKPLAVLGAPGWPLEVRGEDTIRTRVWCGGCKPPVEGWIQAHLVQRAE